MKMAKRNFRNKTLMFVLVCALTLTAAAIPLSPGSLSPRAEAAEAFVMNNLYIPTTNLIDAPAIIERADSWETVTAYSTAAARPATLIMTINDSLDVVSGTGGVLGSASAALQLLNGKIIPAFKISNNAQRTGIMALISAHPDALIVSDNAPLLKAVRDAGTLVRTAWIVTDTSDLAAVVATANTNKTLTVMIDGEIDKAGVTYLRKRWIAVWVSGAGSDKRGRILLGANGVITDASADTAGYFTALGGFDTGARAIEMFFMAHRGASNLRPENTMEAFKEAEAQKADLFEYDLQLTSDNQIVIMHDDSVNRTTNGDGTVASKTLAELKALTIRTSYKIPTLREVFEYFQDKDIVHQIEIKTTDTAIMPYYKVLVEEFNMADRIVTTSFSTAQLDAVAVAMPYLSRALIMGTGYALPVNNDSAVQSVLAATLSHSGVTYFPEYNSVRRPEVIKALSQRGIMLNVYTLNATAVIKEMANYGIAGIVTDRIEYMAKYPVDIDFTQEYNFEIGTQVKFDDVSVIGKNDTGVKNLTEFEILSGAEFVELTDGVYTAKSAGTVTVRLKYYDSTWLRTLYSQPLAFTVTAAATPEPVAKFAVTPVTVSVKAEETAEVTVSILAGFTLSLSDISVESEKSAVCTATYDGATGKLTITGVAEGTASVTVTSAGVKSVTVAVTVTAKTGGGGEGLSGGAIAGIVIGSVAVAGGGAFAAWWFLVRKRKV
ncbi:hypothetical protein FACS1894211_13430 [Clostridia bacterium]|nr:hypothetical protein FACS1894211_13430 [Clostridia bacterium]